MQNAAVIPCKGIGDALLMMIASHQLLKAGYRVTTFHPALAQLQNWFSAHQFDATPDLAFFDLIVVENDNSPNTRQIIEKRSQGLLKTVSIFYPSYLPAKHGPLGPLDQVFDARLTMAENIGKAVAMLLQQRLPDKDNGLAAPPGLLHRYYKQRVVIHPTSSQTAKNWPRAAYLKLARALRRKNFEPVFAVSTEERAEWPEALVLPTLDDLAHLIYESGYAIGNDSLVGHLASNMGLPTLIISDNAERLRLWRPGWTPGTLVTPPQWVPNWKWVRLRQRHWQRFITCHQVLLAFDELARTG